VTEQLTLFGAVSESPPVAGSADDLAAQAAGYVSAEDCAVQNACIGPYSVGPLCWTPCAWMQRRMQAEQNHDSAT